MRYVIGNWKMHGSRAFCQQLLPELGRFCAEKNPKEVSVVVCPPSTLLFEAASHLQGTAIHLGAQDVSSVPKKGARTGEISAEMLLEAGCRYVLVGHSERRHLLGESSSFVAEKYITAKQAGLTPVLCVGETRAEREAGKTEQVIQAQIEAVLSMGTALFAEAMIAYEPVWAIGTGLTATPEEVAAVHAFVKKLLSDRSSALLSTCAIVYGGSVKANQVRALLETAVVDGVLVGGASLEVSEFSKIIECAT